LVSTMIAGALTRRTASTVAAATACSRGEAPPRECSPGWAR
jgi:hypothetical protein